jgi:hypothetical protein
MGIDDEFVVDEEEEEYSEDSKKNVARPTKTSRTNVL